MSGELTVIQTRYTVDDDGEQNQTRAPRFIRYQCGTAAEAAEIMAGFSIGGQYAPSSHPNYGGSGTWYSAEPETANHYTGEYEETTAHLGEGWTDHDRYAVWCLVTGKRDAAAEVAIRR